MAMPAVYPLTALTLSRAPMGRGTLGGVFEFTLMLGIPGRGTQSELRVRLSGTYNPRTLASKDKTTIDD